MFSQVMVRLGYVTDVPNHRIIHTGANIVKGRKLTIPLGLFFTKTVGNYFPLAAVAGCNEIRISIKLRTYAELVHSIVLSPGVVGLW